MKNKGHVITRIVPGSIAEELELEAGDIVLKIDDQWLEDVFDYHFLIQDEELTLLVQKASGEEWELEIEKDAEEDLGIVFENGLMDDYRRCSNNCIFCFIDQMPPGMRETLYFKDDDSRLSFLQGNYITLTNMKDEDIDRIIRYHLAPINISVHTTNPEPRCTMLHNRFAGQVLSKIDRLYEHQIEMNGQIVLCNGINDGEELERTIRDLSRYMPYMQSLSVVPVGLTKYREGLYPLKPFGKAEAEAALQIIERWQDELYKKWGTHFVQASDEFYILAGREIPEEEHYDGYIQLENGVGMVRLLLDEAKAALNAETGDEEVRELSLATGRLIAPYLMQIRDWMVEKFPNLKLHIYPIRNDFFGEMITVAGLVTGTDLKAQLKDVPLGDRLLLPLTMFRSVEEVLLDDITREELENALQVRINIVKSSGQDLVHAILRENEGIAVQNALYQGYVSVDDVEEIDITDDAEEPEE